MDVDAEVQVLGAVMLDPALLDEIADMIQPRDFATKGHQAIFGAMLSIAGRNAPIDPLTVRAELGTSLSIAGGVEYLSNLGVQCLSSLSAKHYADQVASAGRRRRLGAIGARLVAAAETAEDGEVLAEKAMTALYEAGTGRKAEATTATSREVWEMAWASMTEAQKGGTGVLGIPSGFPALDAATSGWCAGDLILLAARTGLGKSSLAAHFAREAVAQGRSVVFVTLEMTKAALMIRMAASLARVDEARLRTGQALPHEIEAVLSHVDELQSDRLLWDEPHRLTVAKLRSKVRLWRKRGQCDLLIVDQLGKLKPDRKENRTREVAEVSGDLKDLAMEFEIPVIALHQINRDGDPRGVDQRPELRHLKDSGATEEDADIALLMHRPWSPREQSSGPVEVCVAKTRRGPVTTAVLNFYGEQTRFSTALTAVSNHQSNGHHAMETRNG